MKLARPVVVLAACMIACDDGRAPDCPPTFQAEAWDAADQLFRGDPNWVGGDGAYSVDLGAGRVLWLFGDTFIDPDGTGARKNPTTRMVSNTVAIQQGYDPADATMRYYWGTEPQGTPIAFFPDSGEVRYWPGHGIRIRDRLLLFLMEVHGIPTGLGFEVADWRAVSISNPDAEPSSWNVTWLDTPKNELQVIVGSASVLAEDGYLYVFSSREPSGGDVYLVRWPDTSAYEGNLRDMAWLAADGTWIADGLSERDPAPVLRNGGTELTVHRDEISGCYLEVQSVGFGPAVLMVRSAPRLTGPWSSPDTLYQPPEHDTPQIMIYQGKAHPHLAGADLVLSYSTNTLADFDSLLKDSTIYYPRFVRLTRQ